MKSGVYGFLYHNTPLKDVTKVEVLNIMYSDPRRKRKCCNNIVKKETMRTNYTDNYLHTKINPKL